MKSKMKHLKEQKWFSYLVILFCVLVLEGTLFNLSAWKTIGCNTLTLAAEGMTDESGYYETALTDVNAPVKNVNVKLTLSGVDRANVKVSLTDAGDKYIYDLPVFEVVPEVADSGYRNIYPYGDVKQMKVSVSVPQGASASINSIEINAHHLFDVKLLRVLVLWTVAAVGYLFFTGKDLMQVPCQRKNKVQLLVICLAVLLMIVFAWKLVRCNPAFVDPAWPHHRQYQELARVLKEGRVSLGEADAALLAVENPYDTITLQAESIPFMMDYAYYEGQYYVYFGIVPELLFFFPYYLLTGNDFPNYLAVFAFYSLMVAGVFGMVWELVHRYGKRVSFVAYLLMSFAISLTPQLIYLLKRPDLYNIPIMGANAFIFFGTFCWLKGLNAEKGKWPWYGLGAFSLALVAGCRPQFLLYVIALFGVLLLPEVWKGRKKEQVKKQAEILHVLCLAVPVLVVAAVVFWYNAARFGSGFDFGATYSLTSNDMNNRGFNLSRLLRGLYSFLVNLPVLDTDFPFLESVQLRDDYMGRNIVEFCFGGIFVTFPFLLSLFGFLAGKKRKEHKEAGRVVLTMSLVSLVIAAFDINGAGILQRYMGDMVFGFVLAAVIAWILLLDEKEGLETEKALCVNRKLYLCGLFGIAFAFLVILSLADGVPLKVHNPALYYRIASYFRF